MTRRALQSDETEFIIREQETSGSRIPKSHVSISPSPCPCPKWGAAEKQVAFLTQQGAVEHGELVGLRGNEGGVRGEG